MAVQGLNSQTRYILKQADELITKLFKIYGNIDCVKSYNAFRDYIAFNKEEEPKSYVGVEDLVFYLIKYKNTPTDNDVNMFFLGSLEYDRIKNEYPKTASEKNYFKNNFLYYYIKKIKGQENAEKDKKEIKSNFRPARGMIYTHKENRDLSDLACDFLSGVLENDVVYKVRILGKEWTIKIKDRLHSDDLYGFCVDDTKMIYVLNPNEYHNKSNKPYLFKRILYHEIIHAYCYQSGIGYQGLNEDEMSTDWIAYHFDELYDLLRPIHLIK